MGKSAPSVPLPPPAPPPPPTAPVEAVDEPIGSSGEGTSTEDLIDEANEKERILPASVIDTETAGRKEERKAAARKGRKKTQVTGPQGLLTPAPVKKRGLLGTDEE